MAVPRFSPALAAGFIKASKPPGICPKRQNGGGRLPNKARPRFSCGWFQVSVNFQSRFKFGFSFSVSHLMFFRLIQYFSPARPPAVSKETPQEAGLFFPPREGPAADEKCIFTGSPA
jgi:hypothetical protein